jgi:hypothetical protein
VYAVPVSGATWSAGDTPRPDGQVATPSPARPTTFLNGVDTYRRTCASSRAWRADALRSEPVGSRGANQPPGAWTSARWRSYGPDPASSAGDGSFASAASALRIVPHRARHVHPGSGSVEKHRHQRRRTPPRHAIPTPVTLMAGDRRGREGAPTRGTRTVSPKRGRSPVAEAA